MQCLYMFSREANLSGFVFFFKQKTAYEMRISDWSSDVCSSDLQKLHGGPYQTAGLPDLIFVIEGRIYGFEVKKQRLGESAEHAYERATILQKAGLADLRRARGVGAVVLRVYAVGSEERRVGKECVKMCRSSGERDRS